MKPSVASKKHGRIGGSLRAQSIASSHECSVSEMNKNIRQYKMTNMTGNEPLKSE